MAADLAERARRVRLLLFDVDGVLTDGKILLHADGTRVEAVRHPRRHGDRARPARRPDGRACCRRDSRRPRPSGPRQLRIPIVRQGASDKLETLGEILAGEGLADDEVAYMGDDLLDLPVLGRVGPGGGAGRRRCRRSASASTGSAARRGGDGAVRELVELVLKAQGRWETLLATWLEAPSRA